MKMERKIFSRFWYVRTNTLVYDYSYGVTDIKQARDVDETEQDVIRRVRRELWDPKALHEAKCFLRRYTDQYGDGSKPRAIMVTIYQKRKAK